MTFSLIEIVGHLSFALAAVSFVLKDMILLRALAVASGTVGICYNYFINVGPLWIPILWLAVFISINSYRIIGLFVEQRSISFSEEERELFETIFKNFTPLEFMKLMRIAEWKSVGSGFVFAEQGDNLEGLSLLFNGEVLIKRNGDELGYGRDGSMIGEMSFIKGGAANASVIASSDCKYIYWEKEKLKSLLTRNPGMDVGMKHVFSLDLTRKLVGE